VGASVIGEISRRSGGRGVRSISRVVKGVGVRSISSVQELSGVFPVFFKKGNGGGVFPVVRGRCQEYFQWLGDGVRSISSG
jgi:hypothetical protein